MSNENTVVVTIHDPVLSRLVAKANEQGVDVSRRFFNILEKSLADGSITKHCNW